MQSRNILGIDEAGRGPVLGPMIIAGVEIKEHEQEKLASIGVKDSKMLSHSTRIKLYRKIKKLATHIYVECLPPERIDSMMNFMNLNKIELKSMAKIINSSSASIVYIDLPSTSKKNFLNELKLSLKKDVKVVAEHKADAKYAVVSAASIVAKVIREREMDKLRKKYLSYGDIGSGYPSDERTMKFLKDYYAANEKLPEEVRNCWNTVKELKAAQAQKKLFEACSDETHE